MMDTLWRVPGAALFSFFLAWFLFVTYLSGTLGSMLPDWVALVASIFPFLLWQLTVFYYMRGSGRNWCNRTSSILVIACWLLYLFVLLPAGIDTTGSIGGSATLRLLGNLLFAASTVVVFDQLAYAIPREEERVGVGRSRYAITFLQLLFPPLALWVVHNRVAVVAGRRTGRVA